MSSRRFLLTEERMNQYYDELMKEYANESNYELRKIQDNSELYCGSPIRVITGLSAFIFSAILTYFASNLADINFRASYVTMVLFLTILFAMILIAGYISNSIKYKVATRILEEREKEK